MRALTVDELRSLIAHESIPCLSIYMPTRRGGSPEDRHHFTAQVRKARELLATQHSHAAIDALLAPILELDTPEFWSEQLDGLALFRSRNFFSYQSLPVKVEELVVAADSFHIRPLLHYMQSNQRYFLLNLSQGRVSFFKGSAMGLGPIDLSSLPRSLTDAVGVEHRERVASVHSGGKGNSPIYYGQGRDDGVRDEELMRFFRAVDRALWEVLRDETAPLILAAPERQHSIFQSVSRYPHLLHEGLRGNFANAKLDDLHQKAWPIVEEFGMKRGRDVLERYGNQISRERALDDVSSIARFAVQGRVRELIVDRDEKLWGYMDRSTGALQLHTKQTDSRDDDIMDDIAEAVILRGGDVYAFGKSKMPTKSPIAAVLRW